MSEYTKIGRKEKTLRAFECPAIFGIFWRMKRISCIIFNLDGTEIGDRRS